MQKMLDIINKKLYFKIGKQRRNLQPNFVRLLLIEPAREGHEWRQGQLDLLFQHTAAQQCNGEWAGKGALGDISRLDEKHFKRLGLAIARFYNRDRPVISQFWAWSGSPPQLQHTKATGSNSFADFVLQLTTSTVLRVVANGRNRRRCILAPPVYYFPVYSPQKSSSSSLWLPLSYISGRLPLFITLLYIPPKSPHHQIAAVYHSPVYSTKSAIK